MFVYWCKDYPTEEQAREIGVGWTRASTPENPITYGVKPKGQEFELMLKLKHGSPFLPDVEDEGFSPCADFPRE